MWTSGLAGAGWSYLFALPCDRCLLGRLAGLSKFWFLPGAVLTILTALCVSGVGLIWLGGDPGESPSWLGGCTLQLKFLAKTCTTRRHCSLSARDCLWEVHGKDAMPWVVFYTMSCGFLLQCCDVQVCTDSGSAAQNFSVTKRAAADGPMPYSLFCMAWPR